MTNITKKYLDSIDLSSYSIPEILNLAQELEKIDRQHDKPNQFTEKVYKEIKKRIDYHISDLPPLNTSIELNDEYFDCDDDEDVTINLHS